MLPPSDGGIEAYLAQPEIAYTGPRTSTSSPEVLPGLDLLLDQIPIRFY